MTILLFRCAFAVGLSACAALFAAAQQKAPGALTAARAQLVREGLAPADLEHLRVTDSYVDAGTYIRHTWMKQQWLGIDIFNSEVAMHQRCDGEVVYITHRTIEGLEAEAGPSQPAIHAAAALRIVLEQDGVGAMMPAITGHDAQRHRWTFDGTAFAGEEPFAELVWIAAGDALWLAWNVNYYQAGGAHWWNVRIDARTGKELERNDWMVTGCGPVEHGHEPAASMPVVALPAAPNDYRILSLPVESPSHGARSIINAPWSLAPIASPFGWHDTNGVAGADHTITRGNNVYASEDANADDVPGYSPTSPTLDFDYTLNLANAPVTYRDAAITNLFVQCNIMHDVFYRYGFDEVAGNFQSNNYGRGGAENDFVFADAQDGLTMNNGSFGTPPDGMSGRAQIYLWNVTTPQRDGDLDNGLVTHEYGHGISNRLVGGPSNANTLANQDQPGEGWSDYLALMMTMEPGDQGTDARGLDTYLLGQPITGAGVRPYKYSTNPAVNSLTYAATNSSATLPGAHGIGTMWCSVLWDMTWALIAQYGFSADLYNGNAGNNISLQLVIDGMKYTPASPGFVDARDGILMADQIRYNGAHQNLIWTVFAARGLGFSANQGNPYWRFDQVEAFDMPSSSNVGVRSPHTPMAGVFTDCQNGLPLTVDVRNNGLQTQGNFNVSYRLDGGVPVTQLFSGTLVPGASAPVSFPGTLTLGSYGVHTIKTWTSLAADQYHADDTLTFTINWQANASPPVNANAEDALLPPTGWVVENPDGLYTWSNVTLAMGANCAATRAFRMNFRTYYAPGQVDRLVSPLINLAGSAGTRLQFHHAYAPYGSGLDDGLLVQISTDCGQNWSTLWSAYGAALGTAPQMTSTYVPTACNQWLLHDIDISAYDGQLVRIRFVGETHFGNDLFLDNIAVVNNGLRLSMKVLLDGPYDGNTLLMRDDLRATALLPANEPYTALGFVQASDGGGEAIQPAVASATGNNAVVDWVLVELRSTITPTVVLATRAALVQRDGDVVDVDGASPIALLAPPGSYLVAVRHRDHLGTMTANAATLSTSTASIDFTDPATPVFGMNGRKQVGAKMLLWPGDATGDGRVKYAGSANDRDAVLSAVGGGTPTNTVNNVYDRRDVNLDGSIKYTGSANDRDVILQTIGGTVPTATRTQQLP
ncbi:MAG: M36 family metallopeptidase [Flavobacteriales bacterium]|nr:M36 family metallopeptidase [Flavobacteriales bacterium]MBK9699738.1 M36 family metallopeptidase [Flavobacteriales bacterium]